MESKKTIDDIVKAESKAATTVYFLSEVGYDKEIFNPKAYDNALKFIETDPETRGVIIDGVLTRLDRPEILNDALTYWEQPDEVCSKAMKEIHNIEQYQHMAKIQEEILDNKFRELRRRLPSAELYLCVTTDDLQFTLSARLNELLLRKVSTLDKRIVDYKKDISQKKADIKRWKSEYKAAKGNSRVNLVDRIKRAEAAIGKYDSQIGGLKTEKELYRVKKIRPEHQRQQRELIDITFDDYQKICDKYSIKLLREEELISIGDLNIDYSHSRHATWGPIKTRDRALLSSTHGKMEKYQERQRKKLLEEFVNASKHGVDVIVESGHHGLGYKQLQKTADSPAETNFKNQAKYDPDVGTEHITVVTVLPFEDQEKISKYKKGKRSHRMGAGKATGSRKHHLFDRDNNDGVVGLTLIRKNDKGIIGTGWVQYQNFIDGNALKLAKLKEYAIAHATSDDHFASPEENWTMRDGILRMHEDGLTKPDYFRGKPAYIKSFIHGGDVSEANSAKYDRRHHHKISPQEVIRKILEIVPKMDVKSQVDMKKLALITANIARSGSVENMAVIMRWVADHFEKLYDKTVVHSNQKHLFVTVTGNHADDVLRSRGIRETDFFRERLTGRKIPTYQVGETDYFLEGEDKNIRVFLGGYGDARINFIEDYGITVKGDAPYGKINLLVQHDPKGTGFSGLIGAGKNAKGKDGNHKNTDLVLAGHTHENWAKIYRTGDNAFSVAYRMGTSQGVTPTEKVYASSVPRTSCTHKFIMPGPGFFYEEAIPAPYVMAEGRKALDELVAAAIGKTPSEISAAPSESKLLNMDLQFEPSEVKLEMVVDYEIADELPNNANGSHYPNSEEIKEALLTAKGKVLPAANLLGISRNVLYRLLEKYDIDHTIMKKEADENEKREMLEVLEKVNWSVSRAAELYRKKRQTFASRMEYFGINPYSQ